MSGVLSLGEVLSVHAALTPDKLAAWDLGRALTYAQYEERANRLANALLGLGLEKGDRIGIFAANRLEWVELYAACAKSGVVAVPVSFRLTTAELRGIVEDSGLRVLFVEAELADVAEPLRAELDACVLIGGPPRAGCRAYEDLLSAGAARPPSVRVAATDPWTIMYTSGTTGRPKGAVRSHESYALFYLMNAVELGLARSDTGLCVMPLAHVNSVFYGFAFVYVGGSVCVYDRRSFDAEHLLAVMAEHRVTFTSLVPTQYTMMVGLPAATRARHELSHVDKLLVSSAPARRETKLAIMECFPRSRLFEAYGSTEAGLVTLLRPEEQLDKLGSIGREIVGSARLRLLDADGHEVPEGEVGELYSRTPTTFDGYWQKPELTARAFRDGYCTAGDMARRDADGFYSLVDRKSNLIVTGGEKVYPSEVEQVLAGHPDVKDVAVIGLPDGKWGEAVTAVVVPRAGSRPSFRALLEHARGALAGYKCPKAVVLVRDEEMPRTPTGKILHRVLRERLGPTSQKGPAT